VTRLKFSVAKISSLMDVPATKRDSRWAQEMYTASSMIQEEVWRLYSEREYLLETVLPLVKKAKSALLDLEMSRYCEEGKRDCS